MKQLLAILFSLFFVQFAVAQKLRIKFISKENLSGKIYVFNTIEKKWEFANSLKKLGTYYLYPLNNYKIEIFNNTTGQKKVCYIEKEQIYCNAALNVIVKFSTPHRQVLFKQNTDSLYYDPIKFEEIVEWQPME